MLRISRWRMLALTVVLGLIGTACQAAGPLARFFATPTPTPTPTFTPTPTPTATPTPTPTPTFTPTPTATPTPTPHPVTQIRLYARDLPEGFVANDEIFADAGGILEDQVSAGEEIRFTFVNEERGEIIHGQVSWFTSDLEIAAANSLLEDPQTVLNLFLSGMEDDTFILVSTDARSVDLGERGVWTRVKARDADLNLPYNIEMYAFVRGHAFVLLVYFSPDYAALGLNVETVKVDGLARLLDQRAQEVQATGP